ncbi:MAG: WD40 repeat domain-containing protein [Nostoc sp. DcaGUA01]|nr:WD40 repeat domain-containing protein [Nostoc sp. DedQUE11]MDZ8078913.1 WD40 repeat domain-containing protein [Nostoc sp. DcaGUA01]
MRSEGRGGVNFRRRYIILAFIVAVALPVITWEGFYIHQADAAIEFAPNNSETTNNFANFQQLYTLKGHNGTVKSLTFTPDSRILISGGAENEGIIRLWNPANGKNLGNINKAHKTAVESLVISPDGRTLVSCSTDNTINLWNVKNFKFNFSRSFVGHTSNVLSLAVSPDSKVLISGALDGIRLWDLLQQRPLGSLARFNNLIYTVAISSDGQTLASGDNKGVIKLWSLSSGKLISESVAHTNSVTAVAFTPDGQTLISASRDRTIKVWNVSSGELFRTLTGHNNWVNAIAINPDGQTLASAGRDGIRLWNIASGELINTLSGHTDWVSAIAFSPNGQILASGGFDQKVKIWGIPVKRK